MKKVLMLIDGSNFSESAFNYAAQLNESEQILLTGLFLPSVDYTDINVYYIGWMTGPMYPPSLDTDPVMIASSIEKFKALCTKHKIEYRIHDGITGSITDGIKKESRYADLIILSGALFYQSLGERGQKEYMEDAIHYAECPLIVVPELFDFPKSIVIAYDGSEESMFAIKQFAYILPEFKDVKTLIVYASVKEDEIPDLPFIEEFAARHFSDLTFFKLNADAKKYFNTWLTDYGNALLISGSYGRSLASELFNRSFLDDVLNDHKLPLFIAHK